MKGLSKRLTDLLNFLKDKERAKAAFTIEEIETATGWSKSTIRTYLSKGDYSEFICESSPGVYMAQNVRSISEEYIS